MSDYFSIIRRVFKKVNDLTRPAPARRDAPFRKQGRSERRGEAYFVPYVEPLSEGRRTLGEGRVLARRVGRVIRVTFSTP